MFSMFLLKNIDFVQIIKHVIFQYCSCLVVTLEIIPHAAASILLKPVVVPTQSIAPVDAVVPSYKA